MFSHNDAGAFKSDVTDGSHLFSVFQILEDPFAGSETVNRERWEKWMGRMEYNGCENNDIQALGLNIDDLCSVV